MMLRKVIISRVQEINIIELAAIFRLADMLDTTSQRAPEILSAIKYPDGRVANAVSLLPNWLAAPFSQAGSLKIIAKTSWLQNAALLN